MNVVSQIIRPSQSVSEAFQLALLSHVADKNMFQLVHKKAAVAKLRKENQ